MADEVWVLAYAIARAAIAITFVVWGLYYCCFYSRRLDSREAELEVQRKKNTEIRRKAALEALINHEVTLSDLQRINGSDVQQSPFDHHDKQQDVNFDDASFADNGSVLDDTGHLNLESARKAIAEQFGKKHQVASTPLKISHSTSNVSSSDYPVITDSNTSSMIEVPLGAPSSATINPNTDVLTSEMLDVDGDGPAHVFGPSCGICLTEYAEGDVVSWSKHPLCRHDFHQHCLLPWLMSHDTCPNCRRVFFATNA